jgi:hypothetical protein
LTEAESNQQRPSPQNLAGPLRYPTRITSRDIMHRRRIRQRFRTRNWPRCRVISAGPSHANVRKRARIGNAGEEWRRETGSAQIRIVGTFLCDRGNGCSLPSSGGQPRKNDYLGLRIISTIDLPRPVSQPASQLCSVVASINDASLTSTLHLPPYYCVSTLVRLPAYPCPARRLPRSLPPPTPASIEGLGHPPRTRP